MDQLNIIIGSNKINRKMVLDLVKKLGGQNSVESIDDFSIFIGIKRP
jgi:hypothetical protein